MRRWYVSLSWYTKCLLFWYGPREISCRRPGESGMTLADDCQGQRSLGCFRCQQKLCELSSSSPDPIIVTVLALNEVPWESLSAPTCCLANNTNRLEECQHAAGILFLFSFTCSEILCFSLTISTYIQSRLWSVHAQKITWQSTVTERGWNKVAEYNHTLWHCTQGEDYKLKTEDNYFTLSLLHGVLRT